MKRAGFTMIELIFVIVILGILSAVALPKFIGVSEQANAGKCKAFYGTLSRTVGPALWSDMVLNNVPLATAFTVDKMKAQIEFPPNSECGTDAEILAGATAGTDYTKVVGGTSYDINTTEANSTNSPTWTWGKTNP